MLELYKAEWEQSEVQSGFLSAAIPDGFKGEASGGGLKGKSRDLAGIPGRETSW